MGEILHLLSTTVSQTELQLIEHRTTHTRIQYIMYTHKTKQIVLELIIKRFLPRSDLNTNFDTQTTCTTLCKNAPLRLTNITEYNHVQPFTNAAVLNLRQIRGVLAVYHNIRKPV
jgi:hypothetical protein